eukprot:gnl/TRDRNA2_/TRDRNA2_74238_c0_seq1.p1 gnl/TRDRNA2_/TRDRNA2_74238_c0~~gnl/TRDRNA2_/TRDRNA2_74238_c0_seq1.p1  ORF type:complete len:388 (-),score=54.97 gnl/TRDRNA2_/TRDRNA2_74238_c0_seq1:69-1193(-)
MAEPGLQKGFSKQELEKETASQNLASHPKVHEKTLRGKGCCAMPSKYLCFEQEIVVIRHADRLDGTSAWEDHPDRNRCPHDCPLTKGGLKNASNVASELLARWPNGHPYKLIECSPYLRCVQTAAQIAQKLKIPMCLDLDLGEMFDDRYMPENTEGKPMHRSNKELSEILSGDYPDVAVAQTAKHELDITGHQPPWPEPSIHSRLRFVSRFEQIAEHATKNLISVIIVTHADALSSIAQLALPSSQSLRPGIPYAAYLTMRREVAVATAANPTVRLSDTNALDRSSWIGEGWDVEAGNGAEIGLGGAASDKLQRASVQERNDVGQEGGTVRVGSLGRVQSARRLSCLGSLYREEEMEEARTSSMDPEPAANNKV